MAMTDLLTDLTNATEGSRALSDRVLLALDFVEETNSNDAGDEWTTGVWVSPSGERYGHAKYGEPLRPNPTVNLQDAVDLSPVKETSEKRLWQVSNMLDGGASGAIYDEHGNEYREFASTPALAFCAALIKFLEAQT